MSRRVSAGDTYFFRIGQHGTAVVRVLFVSACHHDAVLLGVCGLASAEDPSPEEIPFPFDTVFTSVKTLESGHWHFWKKWSLSESEKNLTHYVSIGDHWLGDKNLGEASPLELKELKHLQIFGEKLLSEFIIHTCPVHAHTILHK